VQSSSFLDCKGTFGKKIKLFLVDKVLSSLMQRNVLKIFNNTSISFSVSWCTFANFLGGAEESEGVPLLVVPEIMIFLVRESRNYTSVPYLSLIIGRAFSKLDVA